MVLSSHWLMGDTVKEGREEKRKARLFCPRFLVRGDDRGDGVCSSSHPGVLGTIPHVLFSHFCSALVFQPECVGMSKGTLFWF